MSISLFSMHSVINLILISAVFFLHALPTKAEVSSKANATVSRTDKDCVCISYNCGCCHQIEWDAANINGSLCVNASYLVQDYGISVTMTYNNFTMFNETLSARNPPPICIGEDIVDTIEAEICLQIYDIQIEKTKYHLCFTLLGRISKLKVVKIPLGCFDNNIPEPLLMSEEKVRSMLFRRKKVHMINELPNVIMV